MEIKTIVVTPFVQNCRVLADASGTAAVVDPGGDVSSIIELIAKNNFNVTQVLLTHAHIDHAAGVAPLLAQLSERQERPQLVGHRADRPLRESIERQALLFGLSPKEYHNCPEPDRYIDEDDEIVVGTLRAKVLFTPGHAPGHVSFFFALQEGVSTPILIAGDTIFAGAIGRTDLPGGDYETLISSINSRIMTLPDNTIIMSGHGDDTTVELERRRNPFL